MNIFVVVFVVFMTLFITILISELYSYEILQIPAEIIGIKDTTGIKLAGKLGFPTVNILMPVEIPCGFYRGITNFGEATILVGKNNKKRADIHFDKFLEVIDKEQYIAIRELKKITNSQSDIISTYNSGCKC